VESPLKVRAAKEVAFAGNQALGLLLLFGLRFFVLQGMLEVFDTLSEAFCQFRDLLAAEQQHSDAQNNEQFRNANRPHRASFYPLTL